MLQPFNGAGGSVGRGITIWNSIFRINKLKLQSYKYGPQNKTREAQ